MPTSYDDANIKCPFYIFSNSHRIKCEGLGEANRLHLVTGNCRETKKHIDRFCSDDYKHCPIANMLYQKYQ